MSRKAILPAHQLLATQSLAASFESEPVTLTLATRVGFSVVTSGVTDNTGVFSVQHRIYKDDRNFSDWVTLSLDSTPTLNDADGAFLLDVSVPPGQVRVAFAAAGSTPDGTAAVWVVGMQEGG